jgi:hypothetical protein
MHGVYKSLCDGSAARISVASRDEIMIAAMGDAIDLVLEISTTARAKRV